MDFRTGRWTHVFSPDGLFCCGHTLLDSGDVVIVGGHQANAGYPVRLWGAGGGVQGGPGARASIAARGVTVLPLRWGVQ